jgi:MoaA/NifB/PqqE/SkfB family radical SAM enzyme
MGDPAISAQGRAASLCGQNAHFSQTSGPGRRPLAWGRRVAYLSYTMKPVICNYYLTYRCNAKCGFCNIWEDRTVPASKEAPPEIVCVNLADMRELGVKVVDFTGGEPLLYAGLPEVLGCAKRYGLRTTVTSNGILYPKRAREIAGLVDILQFSIDAADREGHDSSKGVRCYDAVVESVEAARSLGERPTFIHTVTDDNMPRVPDVMSFARSLGVPLFLNPCFSYFGNPGLSPDNAIELGKIARGRGVVVDRGFLKFLIDGGNKTDNPRCLAVSSTIVISPDDKLIIPCFHRKMKEFPVNGGLSELRNSPEVQSEKNYEGTYPFCEGCTVNCYMRASLVRRLDRYFLPSVLSAAKYLWELYRGGRAPGH